MFSSNFQCCPLNSYRNTEHYTFIRIRGLLIKYENECKPCNLLFIKEAEAENSLPFEAWNYRKTFYDRLTHQTLLKVCMYVCLQMILGNEIQASVFCLCSFNFLQHDLSNEIICIHF